jgi:hypothetical protein
VMISDVDEIPRGETVAQARQMFPGVTQVSFDQILSFYHVNRRCYDPPWFGTQAVTVGGLRARGAEDVRSSRGSAMNVSPGGWHFAYLGGPHWIIEKFMSFAHAECNTPENTDPRFIAQCIAEGRAVHRADLVFRTEDTDDLPAYLLENRGRYAHLFADTEISHHAPA